MSICNMAIFGYYYVWNVSEGENLRVKEFQGMFCTFKFSSYLGGRMPKPKNSSFVYSRLELKSSESKIRKDGSGNTICKICVSACHSNFCPLKTICADDDNQFLNFAEIPQPF